MGVGVGVGVELVDVLKFVLMEFGVGVDVGLFFVICLFRILYVDLWLIVVL